MHTTIRRYLPSHVGVWRRSVTVFCMFGVCIAMCHAQDSTSLINAQSHIAHLVTLSASFHPSVKARQSDIASAKAGVQAASWQYYPSLSVLTERGVNQSNNLVKPATSATLRVQQPLWTGGRLTAELSHAEHKQAASQYLLQETKMNAALQTVDAWQSLLTSLGHQEAYWQLIDQLEQLNEMMTRRIGQQISPAIDGVLIKARLAQTQSELLIAQASMQAARHRLEQWAGIEAKTLLEQLPNTRGSSQKILWTLPVLAKETAAKLDIASQQTASVLRLQSEISAAQEDIKRKEAELWPTVSVRVDRQFTQSPLFGNKTAENTIYLGLQYTTGAGLSQRALVEAAMAKVKSLQFDVDSLKLQTKDTYINEWRDYISLEERLSYAQIVQNNSIQLFDSYTRLFVAGRRSWLELLNGLREQHAAEKAFSDIRIKQQASHYRLRIYLEDMPLQAYSRQ